jgi:hypothetical protein
MAVDYPGTVLSGVGQGDVKFVSYNDTNVSPVAFPFTQMVIHVGRTVGNNFTFDLPQQGILPFRHGLYFLHLNGEADVTLAVTNAQTLINGVNANHTFPATSPPSRSLVLIYNSMETWRTFHIENFTGSVPWGVSQGPTPVEAGTSVALLPVPANAISTTNPMDTIEITMAYSFNVGGIGDFIALSWTQPPLFPGLTSIQRCPCNITPGDGTCKAVLQFNQSTGIVHTDSQYVYGQDDCFGASHDTQTNLDLTLPWNIAVGTSGAGVLGTVHIIKYKIFKA